MSNMTRRSFVSAGLSSAAALALAACSGGGEGGEGGEALAPVAGLICLHDENSPYDLNFIKDFKAVCENMGIGYLVKTNIDESDAAYDAAAELVDAGCKIVIADSYGHQDYILQAAQDFPEVQFVSCTGDKARTEGVENYHNAFADIYQGRYMAGVAAGLKLQEMIDAGTVKAKDAKMGYVGAMTYAEVISGYTSFFLGAKSIVKDVTMDVTFTGTWEDETLEKEAATKLMDGGCVLISQHADSMGAPTACENAGVPNVSYNGSTIDACPNTYIISSRINWAIFYEYAIKATQAGESFETDWLGTLKDGSVELSELNEAVAAAGTQEKIDEVKEQLLAGKLHVFDTSTFTVDGKEVTTYKANVEPDEAFAGDTEVIADGYFHESEYRSAPYFDLQVDGITLLDTAF